MEFTTRIDADVPEGRALHLIDVENLAGGPDVSAEVAHTAIDHYRSTACWASTDLTRVACNRWLYEKLAFDLPPDSFNKGAVLSQAFTPGLQLLDGLVIFVLHLRNWVSCPEKVGQLVQLSSKRVP